MGHLDGHEMVKFMTWAQGILTLRPGRRSAYVADVNRRSSSCTSCSDMTIFLVFPFTRLVHVWSAPMWYLGRTGYQVVRTKRPLAAVRRRRPNTVRRSEAMSCAVRDQILPKGMGVRSERHRNSA